MILYNIIISKSSDKIFDISKLRFLLNFMILKIIRINHIISIDVSLRIHSD